MKTIILIIIVSFVCLMLYKPNFKFFLLWLAICIAVTCFLNDAAGIWGIYIFIIIWSHDSCTETKSNHSSNSENSESAEPSYKIIEDGSYKVKNLSNTGYYYSDRKESWIGMFGEEHVDNGEILRKNAYLPGRRDIYNSAGEYIGYEYEDSSGIIHRIDK